jgi:hypothetical protein
MNVQRPEILAECLLLLDSDVLKVLVAEDYDASFSDEEGEFVLLDVVEL